MVIQKSKTKSQNHDSKIKTIIKRRKTTSSFSLLVFYFLLTGNAFAGGTPTASEIIKNLQRNYDETNDAVVHFTQTVVLPFSKLSKTIKGTLYLKKGNKYKIETDDNIIVTDGKTTWTYMPASKQVVIDNYRDDKNTINPDKFLPRCPVRLLRRVVDCKTDRRRYRIYSQAYAEERQFIHSLDKDNCYWELDGKQCGSIRHER